MVKVKNELYLSIFQVKRILKGKKVLVYRKRLCLIIGLKAKCGKVRKWEKRIKYYKNKIKEAKGGE